MPAGDSASAGFERRGGLIAPESTVRARLVEALEVKGVIAREVRKYEGSGMSVLLSQLCDFMSHMKMHASHRL
mgnify:CR=1 FL=1